MFTIYGKMVIWGGVLLPHFYLYVLVQDGLIINNNPDLGMGYG